MKIITPKEVQDIAKTLAKQGFQAYLVGGCLRDLLLKRNPKDWDIATDAKPEEIQKIFPDSVYENAFGTVAVKIPTSHLSSLTSQIVEVTTFRLEGKYTDKRHPDEIKFAKDIHEDLGRRDFTINAIAISLKSDLPAGKAGIRNQKSELADPYGGQKDLQEKLIRAVGKPEERFNEDALRLLRGVRLAAELGFEIEKRTENAIKITAGLLEFISKERLRDELVKLLMTNNAAKGVEKMQTLGLLKYVIPELEEGVGIGQNKHHIYTVFEHNLRSLAYAVQQDFPLDVRLAALFHDVGKPRVKHGEGPDSTFYGHQVIGERMVLEILDRLRFSKELTEKVALLVREHMFVYDPETVTLAGVRRLVRRAGKENIDDLFRLREADRIGSGVPKAQPYRLRYLRAMVEKVERDPIHPKMLKIRGDTVMELLRIEPGPKVGKILAVLLEEVLDKPELNDAEVLKKRVEELGKLSDKELDKLGLEAKDKAAEVQKRIDGEIKKKYFVK